MAPNIGISNWDSPWTTINVVTKVGIKFMHNLSNIPRDVANG